MKNFPQKTIGLLALVFTMSFTINAQENDILGCQDGYVYDQVSAGLYFYYSYPTNGYFISNGGAQRFGNTGSAGNPFLPGEWSNLNSDGNGAIFTFTNTINQEEVENSGKLVFKF